MEGLFEMNGKDPLYFSNDVYTNSAKLNIISIPYAILRVMFKFQTLDLKVLSPKFSSK